MSREHVGATNSSSVHTRRHVAETCSSVLSQRQNYNKCKHMKMKQKQDPPTCPCYATPRVYLDAYIVGARISEDFVPGTCPHVHFHMCALVVILSLRQDSATRLC